MEYLIFIVFDTSVFIALVNQEPGYQEIEKYLNCFLISTVNLAEIYHYCINKLMKKPINLVVDLPEAIQLKDEN